MGGVFLVAKDTVETVLAEQLREEAVLRKIVRGPKLSEDRSADILAVAFVGISAARPDGDEGPAEVGIGNVAIGGVGGSDHVVLKVLQQIDVNRRVVAVRAADQVLPAPLVSLAVVGELDAYAIVPKRLLEVNVEGIPVFELRGGRAVDQIVIEIENRRVGQRGVSVLAVLVIGQVRVDGIRA